jgi:hypothetical protein
VAYEGQGKAGPGVIAVEGQMVEALHVEQAKLLVAEAEKLRGWNRAGYNRGVRELTSKQTETWSSSVLQDREDVLSEPCFIAGSVFAASTFCGRSRCSDHGGPVSAAQNHVCIALVFAVVDRGSRGVDGGARHVPELVLATRHLHVPGAGGLLRLRHGVLWRRLREE